MLNKLQEKFLNFFSKKAIAKDFYWAGGTLLAEYYLQHRISYDLDFFASKIVDYDQLISLIKQFADLHNIKTIQRERIYDRRIFVLEKNKDILKIEFAQYEFPLLKPIKKWPERNLFITSLEDIVVSKIMAIFDRNEPKDIVDLYYILKKSKYNLDQILKWVKKKFSMEIEKLVLFQEINRGITNLDKVRPLLLLPVAKQEAEIQKMKHYFEALTNQYLKTKIEI